MSLVIRDKKCTCYRRNIFAADIFFYFYQICDSYDFDDILEERERERNVICIAWIEILRRGDSHVTALNRNIDRWPLFSRSANECISYLSGRYQIPGLPFSRACPFIYVQFHLVFEPNSLSASPLVYIQSVR